ncbi:MAG: RNA 3'-terminal phosphate cyclase, partial [Betaproteobacteria bacterium]
PRTTVEIDGSHGEGGGQLVRTAVALAARRGKPQRHLNKRAPRPQPGLAPQHLAAVRALASLCDARCTGDELRSGTLVFEPGRDIRGGELRVEVGTAGAVTLVLQALLPALFGASGTSRVTVTGGTDVRYAPSWDYFCNVLVPLLRRMRLGVRPALARRGYYPAGGGEVSVEVDPGQPAPLALGKATAPPSVSGEAHVARLPLQVAERMRDAALGTLADAQIAARVLQHGEAVGTGGAITLWALGEGRLLGASRVAERGVRAETIGSTTGAALAAELASGASLDEHAADQVLVYAALASGVSRFTVRELSGHARTAIWLIEHFVDTRFSFERRGALTVVAATPR